MKFIAINKTVRINAADLLELAVYLARRTKFDEVKDKYLNDFTLDVPEDLVNALKYHVASETNADRSALASSLLSWEGGGIFLKNPAAAKPSRATGQSTLEANVVEDDRSAPGGQYPWKDPPPGG
ncbi:hypothetical protein [Methylobacterium haplocladii]|uniref:hypothetical protein n=1 Tax=Methylobacterium haplocladii TaxID=1176176 RepID=UPI0011BFA64F|nr:hypothetical protein [Methylobacterium haplocladii]